MVRYVIERTMECKYESITMSAEVYEALEELRKYMFENMYLIPKVRDEFNKAQRLLVALFEHVVANPEQFLDMKSEEPVERLAVDFIAGMTDRYAISLYEKLFVPRPWFS
jgi:dGTPase